MQPTIPPAKSPADPNSQVYRLWNRSVGYRARVSRVTFGNVPRDINPRGTGAQRWQHARATGEKSGHFTATKIPLLFLLMPPNPSLPPFIPRVRFVRPRLTRANTTLLPRAHSALRNPPPFEPDFLPSPCSRDNERILETKVHWRRGPIQLV